MAEEKPVHEQVRDLLNKWNPPPTDHSIERLVGGAPEPGDTRATTHTPMEELNSGQNVARDDIDAARVYADDGDDSGDDDGYEDMTNDDLRAELENRDLPTSGKKQELIDRLREDDSEE